MSFHVCFFRLISFWVVSFHVVSFKVQGSGLCLSILCPFQLIAFRVTSFWVVFLSGYGSPGSVTVPAVWPLKMIQFSRLILVSTSWGPAGSSLKNCLIISKQTTILVENSLMILERRVIQLDMQALWWKLGKLVSLYYLQSSKYAPLLYSGVCKWSAPVTLVGKPQCSLWPNESKHCCFFPASHQWRKKSTKNV